MKSLLLFRQSGYAIRTRRTRHAQWLWPTTAVLTVVALLALAGHLDDNDQARQRLAAAEAELTRTFEAGRSAGHADMIASATAAWQAAMTEAEQHCPRRLP